MRNVRGPASFPKVEDAVRPDSDSRAPLEDEAELVRRAIRREADAFGSLYQSYLDRIYRYVYYRVGSAGEAEDLTDQVFLKAWEAIHRYEPRGSPFVAWLYRLAHNLVVDHYRARRPSLPLDEVADTEEADTDVVAAIENRLEVEEVRAAISQLNPDYQQMIVLRFIEELSHAEVARILGKSEGATRVIQHRAIQALARALERTRKAPRSSRIRSPE